MRAIQAERDAQIRAHAASLVVGDRSIVQKVVITVAEVAAEAPQSLVEASNEPVGLPVAPEPVEAVTEALSVPAGDPTPTPGPLPAELTTSEEDEALAFVAALEETVAESKLSDGIVLVPADEAPVVEEKVAPAPKALKGKKANPA